MNINMSMNMSINMSMNMNIKYLIHKETSIVYSKEYYEEHKDNINLTEFYVINGN